MKNHKTSLVAHLVSTVILVGILGIPHSSYAAPAQVPLFLGGGQPLVMLTMSRDHKLYYEAYNDNSDLNGDGILDTGYKPGMLNPDGTTFSYYGYFDSYKCYDWDGTNQRFVPAATTTTKKCTNKWSGDFLNYLTMTRMDAMRKVLYGGYRSTDGDTQTILQRSYVPQDAHSWGKEYESLARDGYLISDYTPLAQPTSGKRHLFANTTLLNPGASNSGPLLRVLQNSDYRIWEWVSIERPVAGDKCLHGGSGPSCGTINDYQVKVEVCKAGLLESDCRGYPRGNATPTVYKPSGLLHEFGEDGSMAFGLLTGSYRHNLQGGVLRKNVENFANEIDATTGKFNSANGVVKTLDSLAITGFGGNYEYSCGWITTRTPNDGECEMWGNPIAEMMYEVLRYYSGASGPTSDYTYSESDDKGLALPKPDWVNPYRSASGGYGWCSKPFMMVISDINPSYDSQVPGTAFGSVSGSLSGKDMISGTSANLNASSLGDTIWANESEGTNVFIGHSKANGVDNYDGAPTPKTVNSFGNIRGLAPEEPTKQGTYYSASVAYFGNANRITNPEGQALDSRKQNVQTFAVALASPLPKIEVPISALNKVITIVPFAKSVGGSGIDATQGQFQPTNQIVDFYIDTIRNIPGFPSDSSVNAGRPYYKFRINYEDVEQGADHDMDAIAEYTISLLASNTLEVKVDSRYAAGGIAQHMGYVISGTTADGTYLVVRDCDTANSAAAVPCASGGSNPGTDPDYFLDRPNNAGMELPLTSTNTFTAGTASAVFMKHDPLWYAAKWGGFTDASTSKDNLPSLVTEWDKKDAFGATGQDGKPDNYFLVTNAGQLKDQLRSAFSEIAERTSSASAIAQNSTRLDTDTMIYQARFNTQDWTGQLRAFAIQTDGTVNTAETWDASTRMPSASLRNIFAWDAATKSANKFIVYSTAASGELTSAQLTALNLGGATTRAEQKNYVDYLRGDSTYEQRNGGGFRNRSVPLGDIINSDPIYVYAEDFGYEALPESIPGVATDPNIYATYRDVTKAARRKMIYVSSNDGIVHGFDASSNAMTGGVEQFAFVPGAALSQMKELAQPGYTHQYIVDGPLFAGDAFLNLGGTGASWKTVLLGTTGAGNGGKSVFALDVTDPDSFSESKVMWEFSNSDDTTLGYPMGAPVIGRMPNGRWAAIFGNGWESSAGTAKLIIAYLDPVIGSSSASPNWTLNTDYCVLATDTTTNNGLGAPALLDTNGDGIVDYVYAGDLQGNVWRFHLDSTSSGCPSGWQMEKKVFQTQNVTCKVRDVPTGNVSNCTSPTSKRQPITGQLEIAGPPSGQSSGYMIFFGTGQYYNQNDPIDMTQQSFYAIWDNLSSSGGATTALVSQSNLVEQTIDTEGTITVADKSDPQGLRTLTYDYRTTSANAVNYASKKGWFMDLIKPNPDHAHPQYQGERVVSTPLLRGGRVVFTTLVPSTDSCAFGGDSWVMEVDLSTGATTSSPSFDINNDRSFSSLDKTSSGAVISGIKSSEGIIKTPAVISAGGVEYKYASGTSGNIQKVVEKGTASVKRTSWRQLQ